MGLFAEGAPVIGCICDGKLQYQALDVGADRCMRVEV